MTEALTDHGPRAKAVGPGPSSRSGTAGTYPLAADHRTIVSWSFSPTSSCSARTQEGRDHEPHALPAVLGRSCIAPVTQEHHEGNYMKRAESTAEKASRRSVSARGCRKEGLLGPRAQARLQEEPHRDPKEVGDVRGLSVRAWQAPVNGDLDRGHQTRRKDRDQVHCDRGSVGPQGLGEQEV